MGIRIAQSELAAPLANDVRPAAQRCKHDIGIAVVRFGRVVEVPWMDCNQILLCYEQCIRRLFVRLQSL